MDRDPRTNEPNISMFDRPNIFSYIKQIEENGILRTLINTPFNSPSLIAEIVSGQSNNGWSFFEGLNELRTLDQKQGE